MNSRGALASALLTATLLSACSDGNLDAFAIRTAGMAGATTAGGSSTAGASATGGAPSTLLLDDFEDGDSQALSSESWWYLVNDGTGTQSFGIELVSRGESTHAIRTQGSDFGDWGAMLGLDLAGSDSVLDASGYGEIHFYARAVPGSATLVEVILNDGLIKYWSEISLGSDFQQYHLRFADFIGPEGAVPLDTSTLAHLQFFVNTSAAFDYWIDDIELAP